MLMDGARKCTHRAAGLVHGHGSLPRYGHRSLTLAGDLHMQKKCQNYRDSEIPRCPVLHNRLAAPIYIGVTLQLLVLRHWTATMTKGDAGCTRTLSFVAVSISKPGIC